MSQKNKSEWKYVVCVDCGVVGRTLYKPDKDINRYVCFDSGFCRSRQELAKKYPEKQICSHHFCLKAAKYKCSCGLFLCENHAQSYIYHPGHFATPLEGLGNDNTEDSQRECKKNVKLYIPDSKTMKDVIAHNIP